MKNTLLSFTLTLALAASAYGQYTIALESTEGGAFDNLVNTGTANSNMRLPTDGSATAGGNPYFTDSSVFATQFISGLGNVDVYKAGVANSALNTPSEGAWADSSNAQAFSINVVGTPTAHGSNPGPRWRRIVSLNNGSTFNGGWVAMTEGDNTISFNAVTFDRMVGFQIAGVVNIDSFSHTYGSGVDSISVVPEPSSYALLAGLFACTYMMVRRRARG